MIAYGGVGALIFSLYIVYDTQLMLGGKHKVYYYNMYFIQVFKGHGRLEKGINPHQEIFITLPEKCNQFRDL